MCFRAATVGSQISKSRMTLNTICKNKTYYALVTISLILCIGGFINNSYETFNKFISGAGLVLTLSQYRDQLPLPVFVLCNHTAYKELPYEVTYGNDTIWHEKRYLELTRDPNNMLLNMTNGMIIDSIVNYTTQELHTSLHGRCLSIYVHQQVK